MPNGRVHYDIWKKGWVVVLPLALGVFLSGFNWLLTAFILFGYLLGRWLDPDLDLLGLSEAEGRMMRELKILGVMVTMWFLPYAYFMRFIGIGRKGHRNFFSHFPIISTSIRLAWLLILPAGVIYYRNLPVTDELVCALTGVLGGLSVADTLHYMADVSGRRLRWLLR